jgi:hypothetical protein
MACPRQTRLEKMLMHAEQVHNVPLKKGKTKFGKK